jgi:hypothetical protein
VHLRRVKLTRNVWRRIKLSRGSLCIEFTDFVWSPTLPVVRVVVWGKELLALIAISVIIGHEFLSHPGRLLVCTSSLSSSIPKSCCNEYDD